MRRPPAGILILGLGGVGKTTLARGFLQWLDQTGGLDKGCFWLSFQEIRSAEYVFNRLGEALFGGNFTVLPMEQKIQALTGALRENRLLLVWDNFESAAGIPGTAIEAKLPEADRKLLAQFLDELRGGATKVIITSRSPEDWLGPQRRYVLPLGGLDREERWEYCNAILRDLGQTINRNDQDLVELMDFLGGHPQAMRAVLPRLEKMSAGQVLAALRSNLADLKLGGDEEARLYATLNFVEQSLPQELRPLLTLVGMHEGFVAANFLEIMAKEVDAAWTRAKIDALMQALVTAGLLRDIGQATYEMHPLLTSYLRTVSLPGVQPETKDSWARAFVDVTGKLADQLAPLERYQQRVPFHVHGQNFHYALAEAERLEMSAHVRALTQSLAAFAQNTRNFVAATRLYERLAAIRAAGGDSTGEAAAYHQLGRVAQEQRDFTAAEQWYRRSLAIEEKLGNEPGAAGTYHQLGILAEEQRDFSAAEQWYRKSLAIKERLGDEHGAATTYHQLGNVAHKRGDFSAAEVWYRKSLAIEERHGNEHGAATTYHQLGMVAEDQRDFSAAEQRYRKSLAIKERLGDEHSAAFTYGQLGLVSGQQGNYLECGGYFIKCMIVFLRTEDRHLAAQTRDNLVIFYKAAPPEDQKVLEAMWKEAGLGDLPKSPE